MRVSSYDQFNVSEYYMNQLAKGIGTDQTLIASGRSFMNVSDDPIRANQAMVIQSSQNQIAQYQRNITDAKGFLSTVDNVLKNAEDVITVAKNEGIQAANGTASPSDLQTFSNTVDQDIQQLVSLANTQYSGKYIFSGEKTQTPAVTYNGTTATYNGDTNELVFDVSPVVKSQVSETGDNAFMPAINALINLKNQINTGVPANINGALTTVDSALNGVINTRSSVGSRMNTLTTMDNVFASTSADLKAKDSQVEGVDMTKVMMDLTQQQQVYQGTIQSSVKVMNLSILNYI